MWILMLGGEGLIRWVYFIVHEALVNSFLFLRVSFVSGITEGRFLQDYVLCLVELSLRYRAACGRFNHFDLGLEHSVTVFVS